MRVVIHDGTLEFEEALKAADGKKSKTVYIHDDGTIKQCMGCFGCWVKTPGVCVMKDSYSDMGQILGHGEELVIISQGYFGTYSPFVKNVLDRCLPYIHPDFTHRDGQIHHKSRYQNRLVTSAFFYGEMSANERQTAGELVEANIRNFNGVKGRTGFFSTREEVLHAYSVDER